MYYFLIAALTDYHKYTGLKTHLLFISQFCSVCVCVKQAFGSSERRLCSKCELRLSGEHFIESLKRPGIVSQPTRGFQKRIQLGDAVGAQVTGVKKNLLYLQGRDHWTEQVIENLFDGEDTLAILSLMGQKGV